MLLVVTTIPLSPHTDSWFAQDKFTPTPGWETLLYDLFTNVQLPKNIWPNNTLEKWISKASW